ncbi:MAG: hypothetical protein WBJ81_03975 [Rickettsiales bacterium]
MYDRIVKLLVDAGATLDIKDDDDFSALDMAMYFKKTEVIKELLAAGASVSNKLMLPRHSEVAKFKLIQ